MPAGDEGSAMIQATFVRKLPGWRSDARLYRLSEPVAYGDCDSLSTDHVIVSAVTVSLTGPETMIFPARVDGKCLLFDDMPGSYRGALDHERAILGAGWEIAA